MGGAKSGADDETFKIYMIRPSLDWCAPRESARPQSDTEESAAQQEVVTHTLKLFLPKLISINCVDSPAAAGLQVESHTWTGSCGLLVSDRRFWKSENL